MDTTLEIPGVARLATGPGGLPRFEITTSLAEAHIYLHGAQVTHFALAGQPPVLFMSEQSWFKPGKAIRGGVPVIFPWFGAHKSDSAMPAHGFARTRSWAAESLCQQADGSVQLVLRLDPDEETRKLWNGQGDWVLRHRITVGSELVMELEIENRGNAPLWCEEALHTYFSVSDVRNVSIHGFENIQYDSQAEGVYHGKSSEPIRLTREVDRVYLDTAGPYTIEDPGLRRRILIETAQSQSAIVWNPWIAKSKALQDMGDDEWPRMVCVETGNVFANALEIAPGGRHISRTTLRSETI